MTAEPVPYAGIASRAVALTIDVLIAQIIVLLGGAMLALAASLVGDLKLDTFARLLAACAWAATVSAYFVLFWAGTGQTPGMRMLGLRVIDAAGGPPSLWRSIVRLVGLGLAIIPFFAGFLPVLVDNRRRALQDFLAGTVVVYADAVLPGAATEFTTPDATAIGAAAARRTAPR